MSEKTSCWSCDAPEEMRYYLRKYKYKELKEQVDKCVNCSVWNKDSDVCYWEGDGEISVELNEE